MVVREILQQLPKSNRLVYTATQEVVPDKRIALFFRCSDRKVTKPRDSYYWCSSCSTTFEKGSECHRNGHESYNLDTEDGKEIVDTHLRMLLVTCKSRWNNALSTHQNVSSVSKVLTLINQVLKEVLNINIADRIFSESLTCRCPVSRTRNPKPHQEKREENGKTRKKFIGKR